MDGEPLPDDSAEVLAAWRATGARFIALARAMDPGARVPWYGPPMRSSSMVSARIMETWAHGEDVAETVGVERAPTDRLRHIAHLGVGARRFSYTIRGLDPVARVFQIADGLLRRGWSDRDVAAALGGNFRRVLREIWPEEEAREAPPRRDPFCPAPDRRRPSGVTARGG